MIMQCLASATATQQQANLPSSRHSLGASRQAVVGLGVAFGLVILLVLAYITRRSRFYAKLKNGRKPGQSRHSYKLEAIN